MDNYTKANIESKRHFSIFSTNCHINKAILNMSRLEKLQNCPNLNKENKIELRSNSIFAFQNNDLYSNIKLDNNKYDDDKIFSDFDGNLSIFSNNQEKSNFFKNMRKKEVKDSRENSCSISSDIEKKLDFLDDLEISDAKLEICNNIKSEKRCNIYKKCEIKNTINKDTHNVREILSQSKQSHSGSEISETYDSVNEFSLEKHDIKSKINKRCSAEYGSLATQYASIPYVEKIIKIKLNNLCNTNNFEFDISNSSHYNSIEHPTSQISPASSAVSFSKKCKIPGFIGNTKNILNISPNHDHFSPIMDTRIYLNKIHPNLNTRRYSTVNMGYDVNKNNYDYNNQVISPKMNSNNTFNLNNLLGQDTKNCNIPSGKINQSFVNYPNCHSNYFCMNIPNFLQDDNYVLDNILTLLKDQNGCRMVQKKIEEKMSDYNYILQFYEKIKDYLNEIINDQFGNYVVQKYLEIVKNDKFLITRFFEQIRNNLYNISVNGYGTRFLQKTLECLTPHYNYIENDSLNAIFRDLVEKHIFDLILDTNGIHVFQKIVVLYPKDKNQFIYDRLCKNAFEISRLKQGGCIFQRALDYANFDQKAILVFEVLKNIDSLINDEYGNFIIQQIVFLRNPEFNEFISNYIRTNIISLSKQKFSSNVIDKCILYEDIQSKNKLRNDIIDHIINNKLVGELICDQFGNYVVQKCLQVTDGIRFMAIIFEIKSSIKTLKLTCHGRKIYENLFMQYGDYFQNNKYKNTNDGRRNSNYCNYVAHNKLDK